MADAAITMTSVRRRRTGMSVAGALACALAFAAVLPGGGLALASEQTDLRRVFAAQLEQAAVPGGAFVTVTSSGATSAHGVGRTGDGSPVGADTAFVIGSATKSFTALAVMQLVDAGAVELDAPVRRYVPELRLADGEAVDAITVRHILQHTSGLDDLAGGPRLASAVDGTALDAVAELSDARLRSQPGAAWRYANINYVLAGLVIERASGLDYPTYLRQHLLEPLGMTRTSVLAGEAAAPGQRYWFGRPMRSGPVRLDGILPAGYLATTASDLGRYLALHLHDGRAIDGTRIVSEQALRTMLTPGPPAHLGAWADGATARYAMGWMVGGPWSSPALFHPGNSPDSSAMIALFPDRRLAVGAIVPAGHELPVPGNPSLTDRISRNLISAALEEPVEEPPDLMAFYAAFDAAAVVVLSVTGWSLARAWRALRRRSGGGTAVGLLRALPAAVGAAAVLWLPTSAYGWRGLWTWAPDLTIVLALLATALLFLVVLRLTAVLARRVL